MPRDLDPNVFQFELTCLICQSVEYSQGNLKCHFNERGCRKFLISCGCCGLVFDRPHTLASHLNTRGAVTRDSFYPPGMAVSLDAAVAALYSSPSVVNLSPPNRLPSTAPAALGRDPNRSPPATPSVPVSSSSATPSVPVSLRRYRQRMQQLHASPSPSSTSSVLPAVCILSTAATPLSSSSRSVHSRPRPVASDTTDPLLSSPATCLPVVVVDPPSPVAATADLSRFSTPSPLSVSDSAFCAADFLLSTSDYSDLDCIQEESHPAASPLQDVQVDSGRVVSLSPSTFLDLPSASTAPSPPVSVPSRHRHRSRSNRLPRCQGRSSCVVSPAPGSHAAPVVSPSVLPSVPTPPPYAVAAPFVMSDSSSFMIWSALAFLSMSNLATPAELASFASYDARLRSTLSRASLSCPNYDTASTAEILRFFMPFFICMELAHLPPSP